MTDQPPTSSPPDRYLTWRRVTLLLVLVAGGLAWSYGSLLVLIGSLIDSAHPDWVDSATCVAYLTPLVATVCAVIGALLPSRRWSHRLWLAALVSTGLWAISWIAALASA